MLNLARATLLTLALLIVGSVPAAAAPILPGDTTIGAFTWDLDAVFGPIFTVENLVGSGFDFTNVAVHATLADNSTQVFDLGTISEGQIAQTFDDLTALAISFATLTLDAVILGAPIQGTIAVAAVSAIPDSQAIVFSTAASPTPVPEPSTWLLLGGGIAALVWRRRGAARVVTGSRRF